MSKYRPLRKPVQLLASALLLLIAAVGLISAIGGHQADKSGQANSDELRAFISSVSDQALRAPSTPLVLRAQRNSPAKGNAGKADSVASLIDGLLQKLHKNPQDGTGWLLLARSYEHLGQHDSAQKAYQKAHQLGQNDSTLAAGLDVTEASRPDTGSGQDSELGGRSLADSVAGTATASQFSLQGLLTSSDSLQQLLPASAAVFILVSSAEKPQRPLAVEKYSADHWPIEFRLDRRNLMHNSAVFSSTSANLIVSARISLDGKISNPMPGVKSDRLSARNGQTGLNLELKTASGG